MSLVWHVCVLITWMTCSQLIIFLSFFFFFNDTATTEIYTLSLHDALPISILRSGAIGAPGFARYVYWRNRDGYRPGLNRYPLTMRQPMLYEQTIHHLDEMRFVYDAEVERVSCRCHNPPWSMYQIGRAHV